LGGTQTDDEVFVARVNVSNMAGGDHLFVRSYIKTVAGGALALFQQIELDGAQTEKVVDLDPVGSVHGFELRILQSAGTGRSFEWSIVKVV
jgi:hypothetical protein